MNCWHMKTKCITTLMSLIRTNRHISTLSIIGRPQAELVRNLASKLRRLSSTLSWDRFLLGYTHNEKGKCRRSRRHCRHFTICVPY